LSPGEGQRRVDGKDGRTYEVRSAYRRDPSPDRTDVIISLLALVIIGCVFGACVAWVHIP
jgi:hypothetical protein